MVRTSLFRNRVSGTLGSEESFTRTVVEDCSGLGGVICGSGSD